MTAPTVVSSVPATITELYLASALFGEVSSLTTSPTDGIYADCMVSAAFGHLLAALQSYSDNDGTKLSVCADVIEGCGWLSQAVRSHVSDVLRQVTRGDAPVILAYRIVLAASQKTTHAQFIDCLRAIGSDGLGRIADAIEALIPSDGETVH